MITKTYTNQELITAYPELAYMDAINNPNNVQAVTGGKAKQIPGGWEIATR